MNTFRRAYIVASREKQTIKSVALTLTAIAVVCWFGANSLNYVSAYRPGPDAGGYSAGGMMVREGKVLYREIDEMKPPIIYTLNAFAVYIGGTSFHSIRVLERFFAVIATVLIFFIVYTVFKRRSLAALSSIAYSLYLYNDLTFEEGNVTEEYAVVFVLGGILSCIHSRRLKHESPFLLCVAGLCFSCATLTKEPFLLSSVPWFFYIVWGPGGSMKPFVRRSLFFVLGAFIPFLIFLAYLIRNTALSHWLDTIHWSLTYVELSEQKTPFLSQVERIYERLSTTVLQSTHSGRIAFGVGIFAALSYQPFLKKYGYFPLVATIAFLMDLFGATISDRLYGHYFLQVVPAFILCAASGGAFFLDVCDEALGDWRRSLAILLLVICLVDYSAMNVYWNRLQQPFERVEIGLLSKYIQTHAKRTDHLWIASNNNLRFYIETGLTSPVRSHFALPEMFRDTWKSSADEKIAHLKSELQHKPPVWIILNDQQPFLTFLVRAGIMEWVNANYSRMQIEGAGSHGQPAYLYAINNRAKKLLSIAPAKVSRKNGPIPTSAAEYINLGLQHYKDGEWEKCIQASIGALIYNPSSAVAYNNICSAYIQLENFDSAILACNKALVLRPEFPRARNNLNAAIKKNESK